MVILLKGERHGQILTGANLDTVLLAYDLPAGSVLQSMSFHADLVGTTLAQEREKAIGYAAAAYVIELDDPDTVVNYDELWDRHVPKYTDVDAIDLDTGAADVTPFWEPGEANFDEVFDMGDMPTKLWMRRRILNFANPGSAGFRFQPAETPFEPQWIPADSFGFQTNRKIRVRAPSVVLVALASPALDDTTTSRAHLTEFEWGQIQFAESTLERALMDQMGLTETGAETPWEEASDVLRKHLAPDVFEATAAAFITEGFNLFCNLQFSHTVPGAMSFRTVDLTP